MRGILPILGYRYSLLVRPVPSFLQAFRNLIKAHCLCRTTLESPPSVCRCLVSPFCPTTSIKGAFHLVQHQIWPTSWDLERCGVLVPIFECFLWCFRLVRGAQPLVPTFLCAELMCLLTLQPYSLTLYTQDKVPSLGGNSLGPAVPLIVSHFMLGVGRKQAFQGSGGTRGT
jgi:hypothetical protein